MLCSLAWGVLLFCCHEPRLSECLCSPWIVLVPNLRRLRRAENFRDLTGSYGIFKNATVEGADHLLTSGGLFFAPKQSEVTELDC